MVTSGIEITPPMAGEWRWESDTELLFTPKEDWAVDQDYVVRLDKSLLPDHVRLSRYEHRFTSAAFSASINELTLYQDPKNPKLKKVVATLQFTHPVNSADLEKRVTLRMAGQKGGILGLGAKTYPFTVSYNKFKAEA